uniref:Uncharacterized protein n=1 Tax=Arundo donax TaxID=35708 RepID=A0A0A9ARW3_ARUDO
MQINIFNLFCIFLSRLFCNLMPCL